MTGSAFFQQPPKTEDDYWIARSLLLPTGLKLDPKKGIKLGPPRPPPDLYHFETKGPGVIAGSTVCIVIMVSITFTRLLLRWFKASVRFGADDWLIIPGLVSCSVYHLILMLAIDDLFLRQILAVAWPALQIAMVQYGGAGKHMYDVTYHEFYMVNWLGSIAKMDFFVAVGIIKMSIVVFNIRLTGLSSHKWLIAHWTFFGLLLAYTLAAFFMNVFQCNPPSANFDSIAAGKLPIAAKCLSENRLGTILSSLHVAMDFCLLAVPIIVLWKVQMDWAKKIRLYIIFSLGAISCIGSVFRQLAQAKVGGDILCRSTSYLPPAQPVADGLTEPQMNTLLSLRGL
jgi:hypothetical protein